VRCSFQSAQVPDDCASVLDRDATLTPSRRQLLMDILAVFGTAPPEFNNSSCMVHHYRRVNDVTSIAAPHAGINASLRSAVSVTGPKQNLDDRTLSTLMITHRSGRSQILPCTVYESEQNLSTPFAFGAPVGVPMGFNHFFGSRKLKSLGHHAGVISIISLAILKP